MDVKYSATLPAGEEANNSIVLEALNKFSDSIPVESDSGLKRVLSSLKTAIENYYTSDRDNFKPIIFTSGFPEQTYSVSLASYTQLCDLKQVDDTNSVVICYYPGNIDTTADHESYKDVYAYPGFTQNPEKYKLFLHWSLFKNVFESMTKENKFLYELNNNNRLDNFSFKLDIKSLGIIFPELYYEYDRSGEIIVKNVLSNIRITNPADSLKADVKFDVKSSIVYKANNTKKIIEFNVGFSFKLNNRKKAASINFCVDNTSFDLDYFNLISAPRTTEIFLFKNWIKTSYRQYLNSNEYCLFKDDFNLNLLDLLFVFIFKIILA
jgi:hypothetical protein